MTGEQFACVLPAVARSVTEARRFAVDALRSWGRDELTDTVALLTSEVVTNAVLHARTSIELVVRAVDGGVSVEVTDGSLMSPRARRAHHESTNGRGMSLLDQLATAWEVRPRENGKTVCFTVTDARDPWASFTNAEWAVDG